MRIPARGAFVALMVFTAAGAATAQQPSPQEMPVEVQGWVAELQQIQQQLAPLQERAMQAPALQEQQRETTEVVRNAMIEVDPNIAAVIDRMEAMMQEAQAARAAGDTERLVALTAEAEEIQPHLARVQIEAMQRDDVTRRIAALQTAVHAEMRELEPGAGPLIDRYIELDRRITAALRNATG
jgi:hypothetical protein